MKPAPSYPYVQQLPWLNDFMNQWWAQHWFNPASYPREAPIIWSPGGIRGGPKFSGDVKGLQRTLYEGEKPWSAVGTTRHVEAPRSVPGRYIMRDKKPGSLLSQGEVNAIDDVVSGIKPATSPDLSSASVRGAQHLKAWVQAAKKAGLRVKYTTDAYGARYAVAAKDRATAADLAKEFKSMSGAHMAEKSIIRNRIGRKLGYPPK